MQTTSNILMIRPVNFGFNAETAVNNAFQLSQQDEHTQDNALKEFNDFVQLLDENGIDVTVINDTPSPYTPDSIFPNNWVSFHDDGVLCLYPMYAVNRRKERKPDTLKRIAEKFQVSKTIDFSYFENKDLFLEGTGSMVLDRENKIAYACLSPRTNKKVLELFCEQLGFRPVVFDAEDTAGRSIYHSNVMMCVADKFIVICLDSISKREEKQHVVTTIRNSGKEIIEISMEQMNHFAGNMLQVHNTKGEKILVMSTQAYESLTPKQVKKLETFNKIIHSSLNTIETNGGGSARCMMAEVYLKEK
ncbi:MAG TPA: arginine deiminase-related protein [Puia sp.]|nr:arginine deiminase-related protein [Puia sp.]